MLIYNTSFHVDTEHELSKFLTYMRDVYLPAIAQGGLMQHIRFVRLLTDIGDNLIGYSVMGEFADMQKIKKWKLEIGREADANFHKEFGEKVLNFSTTMIEVDLKLRPSPNPSTREGNS